MSYDGKFILVYVSELRFWKFNDDEDEWLSQHKMSWRKRNSMLWSVIFEIFYVAYLILMLQRYGQQRKISSNDSSKLAGCYDVASSGSIIFQYKHRQYESNTSFNHFENNTIPFLGSWSMTFFTLSHASSLLNHFLWNVKRIDHFCLVCSQTIYDAIKYDIFPLLVNENNKG